MTRKYLLLITLAVFTINASAQEEKSLVNWLTFKEAQEKNKLAPRPLLIDFYTDWCGWCKHMMRTTYSNSNIAGYINQNFYPVKFDAETKDTVEYNGKIYRPLSDAPRTAHELTIKFLGEKLSYPSTVFVTNKYEYNMLIPGYLDEKAIEPFLVFMTENVWQTSTFDEFNAHFKQTFVDTNFKKAAVKKLDVKELEKTAAKKPKKTVVLLNAPFCNTGVVMSKTTFMDTSVARYLNRHFYFAEMDVTRSDTIHFQKEKYYNMPVNNFPLHTLAFRLSNNRFALPSVALLDEKLGFIDVLNFYQSPERLRPILEFIATDDYKKKSFQDFMTAYTASKQKAKEKEKIK